jgi:hypothetical protein
VAKKKSRIVHRTATRRPQLTLVAGGVDPSSDGSPGSGKDVPTLFDLPPGSDLDDLEFDPDGELDPDQAVTDMAAALIRSVQQQRRPLDVELAVCDLLGLIALELSEVADEAEVVEVQRGMLGVVIGRLAELGGAPGLAALRALAAIGPASTRALAAESARALAADGVFDQRWAATIGRPTFLRAWLYGDIYGAQTSVGLMFDYGRRQHALLTLIDHELGGGVKDCFVLEGAPAARAHDQVETEMADNPEAFFEDLDAATAAEHLAAALEQEICPVEDDQVEDLAHHIDLLRSRTALLAELSGTTTPDDAVPAVTPGRSDPVQILRIKVSLVGARPPIWRRLEVPAGITLAELHRVLQVAFGWHGGHLHQYELPPVGDVRSWAPSEPVARNAERRLSLGQMLHEDGDKLIYRYDFGDDWEHAVVLEAHAVAEPAVDYPRCTGGRRNAPPEDCGGIPGYAQLVEALDDPDHPDREWLLEGAPEGFDPAAFTVEDVDAQLAPLR